MAKTSDGAVVAFRGRSADETRDIYVARLVDGHWTTPAPVHNDGWKIDGCPVNGPAVTASARDVAVAWFTAATGEGHAFVAFSRDAGRTFDRPIRIDEGSATGHVDASGSLSPALTVGVTLGMHYPRLAQGRNELFVTWSESENLYLRVRTARVPLTRQ